MIDFDLLHKKIKNIRGKVTQENISEKMGVTAKFISEVETNKKNPSTFLLIKFLNILNISFSDLMSNENEQEILKRVEILKKVNTLNFNKYDKELLLNIITTINEKGI